MFRCWWLCQECLIKKIPNSSCLIKKWSLKFRYLNEEQFCILFPSLFAPILNFFKSIGPHYVQEQSKLTLILCSFQAIVNNDVNVFDGHCPYNDTCSMKNLSCRYLDHLRNNSIIKEYYADLTSALNAVKEGDAWGALYFNENYTDSLVARLALGKSYTNFI